MDIYSAMANLKIGTMTRSPEFLLREKLHSSSRQMYASTNILVWSTRIFIGSMYRIPVGFHEAASIPPTTMALFPPILMSSPPLFCQPPLPSPHVFSEFWKLSVRDNGPKKHKWSW